MSQWIRKIFKPPLFNEEDKTRMARVLNILAWGIIVGNLIGVIVTSLLNETPEAENLTYISLILICGVSIWIMHRGYIRQASYLFALTLLAMIITISLFFGGVSGPSAGSFIAVPLIASLLLGIRGGWIFSLLSILAIISLVAAEQFGWAELHSIHNNPFSFAAGLIGVEIFMMLIQYLFTHELKQTLEHTRQNEQLQKELNLKLQSAQQDIEAQAHELAEINQTLELRVEERTRELALINEMRTLLQASISTQEAYQLIGQVLQKLFPQDCGALYICRNDLNLLEAAATWGEPLRSEERFTTHNCWGLRRGQVYIMEDNQIGLPCPHVQKPLPCCTLCIPLTAQGAILGILHLQTPEGNSEHSSLHSSTILEAKKQLAVSVGDQIALSLSNLNMQLTLQQQAIHDPLTGLYNRRYMAESLARELRRTKRKNLPLSVMMMDIDYFKTFNDTYGHETGDAVLREVGAFLLKNVRSEDIICRYGGEEFLLILPETPLESVLERANEIREGITRITISNRGQTASRISVSIGVACFPEHGESGPDLIRAADTALYQAKGAGRNQLIIYDNPQ